jgi:hypothetical protein
MQQIKQFFARFIGQLVWQVRRGHGSFLTMEFGTAHLAVREPISASSDSSEKVKRNLQRRHVTITGDWHFWVQYGDWKITTADGVLSSEDPSGSRFDECLCDLDGQKLVSVGAGTREQSCAFNFDLGGILEIWPSKEIPDDQWGLYGWDGDVVTCRNDGVLVFEKADMEQRVYKPLQVTWPAGNLR